MSRPGDPVPRPAGGARGLTMVELIIAAGLTAVLMAMLFRLIDVTLNLWTRGETRRQLVEQSAATGELFQRDLGALHGGQQGDLLVEWHNFDVDGDEVDDRAWPRLRFVRQASAADIARLRTQGLDAAALAARSEARTEAAGGPIAGSPDPSPPDPGPAQPGRSDSSGLMEVCWAILPTGSAPDEKGEGVLWRGERLIEPGGGASFLSEGFFDAAGHPPGAVLNEVTGGVLWFGLQFAAQTTVVHGGWRLGWQLADAAPSWDAWNRNRPNLDEHRWNERHPGMPKVKHAPLLPRVVRLEMEFESAAARRRRTRLAEGFDTKAMSILVENGDHVPRRQGSHLLIGAEWLEVVSVSGERINVRRGARATVPTEHSAGEMVHHGESTVVEIPIALYSDDWNL